MNIDSFVDGVFDELDNLFNKDKNYKKRMLGDSPSEKIIDNYSDWLANNTALSPKIAANAIYKDVIKVDYVDFGNRTLKRGVQLKNQSLSFNDIYGTQKEIDTAKKILNQLKEKDGDRYNLIQYALDLVKKVSDRIKPTKNIFGKTTNMAKQAVITQKLPKFSTLQLLMKMSNQQLTKYISTIEQHLKKYNTSNNNDDNIENDVDNEIDSQ